MYGVSVGSLSSTGNLMDINNEISNVFKGCEPGDIEKSGNVTSDEKTDIAQYANKWRLQSSYKKYLEWR